MSEWGHGTGDVFGAFVPTPAPRFVPEPEAPVTAAARYAEEFEQAFPLWVSHVVDWSQYGVNTQELAEGQTMDLMGLLHADMPLLYTQGWPNLHL